MKNTSPSGIRRIPFRISFSRKYSTKHVKKKNKKTSAFRQADIRKMLFRFTTISTCGNTADPVKKSRATKTAAPAPMPGGGFLHGPERWCLHARLCLSGRPRIRSHSRRTLRFPIFPGRHPVLLFKGAVKGPLAFKTAFQTDFGNRPIRIFQTDTRIIQPGVI